MPALPRRVHAARGALDETRARPEPAQLQPAQVQSAQLPPPGRMRGLSGAVGPLADAIAGDRHIVGVGTLHPARMEGR